jgi:outer membrane protein
LKTSLFYPILSGEQCKKDFIGSQVMFLLTFIILHLSIPFVYAQQSGGELSLRQAVAMAFVSDNNLMAAEAYRRASEYDISRARTSYLPKLDLSGSYSHWSKVNEFSIPIGITGMQQHIKTGADNPANINLGLSYNLYTFGRRPASVAIARAENRLSDLHCKRVKKNLFDTVARTYFAVVFANESLHMLQKEKNRFEQIYKIVEDRFRQELISEFDLLQTQFRFETYKKTVLEMSNTLKMARLNLTKLLGMSSDMLPTLSDGLDNGLLMVPSFEDWDEIYPQREDYLGAVTTAQKAHFAKKITKSAYFPSLTAFTSYDWRNGYQPDVNDILGNFIIGINFNWLLFDGFARRTDILKQNYMIKASNRTADDLKLSIPFQIKTLQLSLENDSLRIDIQKQALSLACRSMAIAQKKYDIGDLTMIELLEAENQLSQAELELLELRYKYILTQLDLKKASGIYPEIGDID